MATIDLMIFLELGLVFQKILQFVQKPNKQNLTVVRRIVDKFRDKNLLDRYVGD